MSTSVLFFIVFGCVFGAAYLATRLRAAMPEHHLSADTKDTVKLAMGLVATMTALVHGEEALTWAMRAIDFLFSGNAHDAPDVIFANVFLRELPCHDARPDATMIDLLVGEKRPFQSNGDAKRAVQANSVSVNGAKLTLDDLRTTPERIHGRYALIRQGKKSYFLADFGA